MGSLRIFTESLKGLIARNLSPIDTPRRPLGMTPRVASSGLACGQSKPWITPLHQACEGKKSPRFQGEKWSSFQSAVLRQPPNSIGLE